ncbi:uncharacterized protein EDB91DRAFT_1088541 [Suillus paluster]|uniref:uncharacterized protein n=1 Tax=Suillus paluster TaxID=48578 RepID=UPI001B8690D4|nr:uncharacterized protein EDB91DRAFT_1088541 [Suillus paluster]KAG1721213.1 hypothetical protein EDB91DRAFT_1088541 [Suillus paluster]
MVNTENNGIVLILRLQTGDVLDLQVHKHVQNNKQHQIDISFGSLQAAPARIQRIYHNVNFHAHHLASPTQCSSVFSVFFHVSLWVIWGLHAVHATWAYMRCMPLCMPLSHKTLMQHKFQKLSAVFDAGRHFYHLTLSQYDFQS